MANVVVRGAIERLRQEPHRRVEAIAEGITGDRLRVIIQRLTKRIGELGLEAVAESFLEIYIESVVVGRAIPIDVTNNP